MAFLHFEVVKLFFKQSEIANFITQTFQYISAAEFNLQNSNINRSTVDTTK
jgi:hypothetical protein